MATAESCTGGMLAKRITDVPGSSAVFRTGLVTYDNEPKTRLLGVPEDMLARHGAVSEEVARAMAEGARRESGADYGFGITGIAGPDGGSGEKPVGLVYIALATPETTHVLRMQSTGLYRGRNVVRETQRGQGPRHAEAPSRWARGDTYLHSLNPPIFSRDFGDAERPCRLRSPASGFRPERCRELCRENFGRKRNFL